MIAPEFSKEALELLGRKKNLRILALPSGGGMNRGYKTDIRQINGGYLVQQEDYYTDAEFKPKTVSKRAPTDAEMQDMLFAWRIMKHIKSNAIALVKDKTMLGMGAGQPNRVVSVALSLEKAGEAAKGCVLASDAMIPFPDTVEVGAKGGATAVIQTGGSVNDSKVIETADKYNMAMVLTGTRHFRH
jgi:phosphoribosylaminoimidazolecarboxamide formyltransferase/IMP cyclohydrolase